MKHTKERKVMAVAITVGQLKEIIRDLPDDMEVFHWDEMVPVGAENVEVQQIFPLDPEREVLMIS